MCRADCEVGGTLSKRWLLGGSYCLLPRVDGCEAAMSFYEAIFLSTSEPKVFWVSPTQYTPNSLYMR